MTPLHTAARNGHFEVCKLILENVEDKNPPDNIGSTPINEAIKKKNFKIARLILNHTENASINEPPRKKRKLEPK